ncbi:heavy metal-associated domain protein [Geotalea daltonii FRC-32]|uniref:Heavy metal-associated domain protein n=1 Tax=Geotalea daltonii (strain DSM 22248 / JCM 15807 / FRC-32) TaxID=316067 RepID=B9M8P0_GEODF|nr:cation transporter [Geotalea daltonii]ACM18575.1 heavy metal-associated domain protein [Geotalea daltonii FRC-32]
MNVDINGHLEKIEIGIKEMDCADCARHIKSAVESVPGVAEAEVLFSAQKAVLSFDPAKAGPADGYMI